MPGSLLAASQPAIAGERQIASELSCVHGRRQANGKSGTLATSKHQHRKKFPVPVQPVNRVAMRLADFIELRMEAILAKWDSFARTRLPAAASMDQAALRDHGRQILEAVAKDLRTSQTRDEQDRKSKGLAEAPAEAPETAAQTHAILRARSGFDINQLASEYRALRASVLRLWTDEFMADEHHLEDMIRFNEAVDQALAESISFFHSQVERSRNLFLGVLGHDMRNPLQTIHVTAAHLAALNAGDQVSVAACRLIQSGARLKTLLDDLVDFNRFNLGLGIRINPAPADLATAFEEEIELLRIGNAGRIEFEVKGDCRGSWDVSRLQQMLGNLVQNAFVYGAPEEPVRIVVTGTSNEVRIEVTNRGAIIDADELEQLFTPLRRGRPGERKSPDANGSMGLGLFIVREIARAHGGEVKAESDKTATTFIVTLPRR